MNSAFGVDHGEISKADLPKLSSARKIGRAVRVSTEKLTEAGERVGNASISVKGLGRATGRGVDHVSNGLYAAGGAMQQHPGKTGAVVAGLGAGAGVGAYRHARNQKPPKKNKIPKAM